MKPYLVKYAYTESGIREICWFICRAKDRDAAASKFWNQHPNGWGLETFSLISVHDGATEMFWSRTLWKFVTIPQE